MTPTLRQRMGQAAVAAAKAVGYVGAGTVEFIVEQPGGYDCPDAMQFYFMEMNTRLQVEHPVTEAITGEDLVQWQLHVASGQPLPKQQDELRITGHAIEARICAENPDNGFLPATGTLQTYRRPYSSSFFPADVRMDDGVCEGDAISPFYDSMIAKLIVHGDTREQALARLDAALGQTHIVGVSNNVQFLRHVLNSQAFSRAQLDTALIERERCALFEQDPLGRDLAIACAVAYRIKQEQAQQDRDPFSHRDGWRLHGHYTHVLRFNYRGQTCTAELSYGTQGIPAQLSIGQAPECSAAPLQWHVLPQGDLQVRWGHIRTLAAVYGQDETLSIFTPAGATQITEIDQLAHAGDSIGEGGHLTAPMPGKVISFTVQVGDTVSKGQPLAVMEAMKMEHTIAAPADGVVEELLFIPGDQVGEGQELLRLCVV